MLAPGLTCLVLVRSRLRPSQNNVMVGRLNLQDWGAPIWCSIMILTARTVHTRRLGKTWMILPRRQGEIIQVLRSTADPSRQGACQLTVEK